MVDQVYWGIELRGAAGLADQLIVPSPFQVGCGTGVKMARLQAKDVEPNEHRV